MKFSTLESMYFRNLSEKFKSSDVDASFKCFDELENEFNSVRPTNKPRILELTREMQLLSYFMGLQEVSAFNKAAKGTDFPMDSLSLVICDKENPHTGTRNALPLKFIKSLKESNLKHFGFFCSEQHQQPDMNTYMVIVRTDWHGNVHEEINAVAESMNLDIRYTTTKWFK